jgi:hypothetical protein
MKKKRGMITYRSKPTRTSLYNRIPSQITKVEKPNKENKPFKESDRIQAQGKT